MQIERKNVLFTNWTNFPFTWTWGGRPMTFSPGQTMMMEAGLAIHFATHLADEYINGIDAWPKFNSRKLSSYQELVKRAVKDATENDIAFIMADGVPDVADIKAINANRKTEEQLRKEMAELNKKNLVVPDDEPAEEKKSASFCDQCDSKGRKHKKDCPTLQKEFAELDATA